MPNFADIVVGLDTVWVLISAFLVFFMQAGFGMVEAGFIRAKNATNILTKNFLDFCMASLGFFAFGYAIMFGTGNALIGLKGWFLMGAESGADVPLFAFWLFQAAFCGAAATIVAGGMAERMRFPSYPIVGHWVWGGGWISTIGFADFAGSTVVHTTGGIAALVGTMILKPRIGKYRADGSPNMIPGTIFPSHHSAFLFSGLAGSASTQVQPSVSETASSSPGPQSTQISLPSPAESLRWV